MGSRTSKPIKLPRPAPPDSTVDYTPRDSLSFYSKANPAYIKRKKFKWKPKKKTNQQNLTGRSHDVHVTNDAVDSSRDEADLSTNLSDDTDISDIETRTELIPSSLSATTMKGRQKPKPQFNGFIQTVEKEYFVRQLEIERQVKQQELHQRQEERIKQRLKEQILQRQREEEERRQQEMRESKLEKEKDESKENKTELGGSKSETGYKTDRKTPREKTDRKTPGEKTDRKTPGEKTDRKTPRTPRQTSVKLAGERVREKKQQEVRKDVAVKERMRRVRKKLEDEDGSIATETDQSKINLTGITKTGWGKNEPLVEEDEDPEPHPPTFKKKDLIPDLRVFKVFDQYAIQSKPPGVRASVSQLVDHLKKPVENYLQMIRVFFRWITYNISFDSAGYYDASVRQATDPAGVLATGVTVSDGYANLFEAMCRYVGIPVKVIHGITKGYEYQVGDDLTIYQNHTLHAWNAVYIIDNWFFVDCAWGAGVLSEDRAFVRQFQEFYFLTDPENMIVDHFPYMDRNIKGSTRWQLLESPLTINRFSERLKLEIPALEWDVRPQSDKQEQIITVKKKAEILLQERGEIIDDYQIYFGTKTVDENLVSRTFAYKIDVRNFKVLVHPPKEVDYILKIYGKRSADRQGEPQLLIQYILKVLEVQEYFRPYPTNFRVFGAVPDFDVYGFLRDIGNDVIFKTSQGEVVIPLKTYRVVQVMTKLEHINNKTDLTNYCLVNSKEEGIAIKVRCPYDGYYKFTLFAKKSEGGNFRPVATFLIDCEQATQVHSSFPDAFEPTLKLKCSLYKPLWKDLPANSHIKIIIVSPALANVKVKSTSLKHDGDTFEGTVVTPGAGQPFTVYGTITENGILFALYRFNIF